MVYTNEYAIHANFKPGDKIYGCAFKLQNGKSDILCFSEPVLGEFCCTDQKSKEADARAQNLRIKYFVPCGKNDRLTWSKAVLIESRMFATTENEATALFNHCVFEMADWFRARAGQTEQQALSMPLPSRPEPENGQEFLSAENFNIFSVYVFPHLTFRPQTNYRSNSVLRVMPNGNMHEIMNARLVRTVQPVCDKDGNIQTPSDGYVVFDVPGGPFRASYQTVREFPGFLVWDFPTWDKN